MGRPWARLPELAGTGLDFGTSQGEIMEVIMTGARSSRLNTGTDVSRVRVDGEEEEQALKPRPQPESRPHEG